MADFAIQVSKWGHKALNDFERIRRRAIVALFSSVILGSPVDTGRMRGNWQISSRVPASGTVDVVDQSGKATIRKVEDFVKQGLLDKDQVTYLTNNLPYSYSIEFGGYSGPTEKVRGDGFLKQAPKGMVRENTLRISNLLKNRYG